MSLPAAFRRFGVGLVSVVALLLSSASALAETKTFSSTGKEQEFKVPAGVTSIHVVAIGSAGGTNAKSAAGGLGAIVSGDLTVKPEDVLYVEVGGIPFNGGGSSEGGGSGGGASDVRTVSIGVAPSPGNKASLESRLLVAAGGGGGGGNDMFVEACAGGRGGNAEEKGANASDCKGIDAKGKGGEGGGAGEASKGGAGGKGYFLEELEPPSSSRTGKEGQLGVGGAGAGGGGGGLYGGGGGGTQGALGGNGGGGGGSNLVPKGGAFVGTAKSGEEGSVTISYTPPTTCGKTTIGKFSDQLLANLKRVNRCTVPSNLKPASIQELVTYLTPTSHSGTQTIRGVVYADSNGKPGSLMGTSLPFTFTNKDPAGWYRLVFPEGGAHVAEGPCWIGVLTGATGKVAGERFDSVPKAEDFNSNSYTSGASNLFGSFKTTYEEMSLYAIIIERNL
jgi:hypothetical protein